MIKIFFISNQNFANIISILSVYKIKNLKTILIEKIINKFKFSKNIYDLLKKKIILNLIKFFFIKSNAVVGISKKLSLDLSKFIGKKLKRSTILQQIEVFIFRLRVIIIQKNLIKKKKK